MKKLHSLLAAAAMFAAAPAFAQTTVTFINGGAPLAPGETLFADFDTTFGGISGSGYVIQTGSNGQGADPAVGVQGDQYLAVLGGGNASFTFAGLSQLSLDYGSADQYNLFTLTYADSTTQSFTGGALIAASANGNQSSPITNGRLTFTNNTNAITGLSLSSSRNSLEVDNFASISAVPEPATWGMMLIGFGAIGASMRRRRAAGVVRFA